MENNWGFGAPPYKKIKEETDDEKPTNQYAENHLLEFSCSECKNDFSLESCFEHKSCSSDAKFSNNNGYVFKIQENRWVTCFYPLAKGRFCGTTITTFQKYIEHKKENHPLEYCKICRLEFSTKDDLIKHFEVCFEQYKTNLQSRYIKVITSKKEDQIKLDDMGIILEKVQNNLKIQEEQKETYETNLIEIMDVLKLPTENKCFEKILPKIKNLKESFDIGKSFLDEIGENLKKTQNKLKIQEEQRETYEKQLIEIMEVLKLPVENGKCFENILPRIKNLNESFDNSMVKSPDLCQKEKKVETEEKSTNAQLIKIKKDYNDLLLELSSKNSKIQALEECSSQTPTTQKDTQTQSVEKSTVEYREKLKALVKSNLATKDELNKIKQANIELQEKVTSNNIKIKALEESEIKAREFKDRLAAKVCLADSNKESLAILEKLDVTKLLSKYEQVMKTNKEPDSTKLDQMTETLEKVQHKLKFQEEQKDIYETQLNEILDNLKLPAEYQSFEYILPEIKTLKQSRANFHEQTEINEYSNAQSIIESCSNGPKSVE